MNKDPLEHIDALCGNSNATRALRAGIVEFATEQAKFYLRMQDPAWVDKAIQSPEWARSQLQRCQAAVKHGARTMQYHIAPFCEELANTHSKETGIDLGRITLKMKRNWTALKEVGTQAIAHHIGIMKEDRPAKKSDPGVPFSLPTLREGKTSLEVGFSR